MLSFFSLLNHSGHVSLRLELGLFECTSWYARSPINFMSDQELLTGGYHIDTQYRSQVSDLRLLENEYQYYDRSKEAMKKIIKLHRKTGGTVLLVAHAPSLEVLTRHLMNGQPRPERLAELAGKVDFCSMTIVERESAVKPWQFRYSLEEQLNQGSWQQQQQQQQLQPPNSTFSHPKSVTPSAAVYQPPSTFVNYAKTSPVAAPQWQFVPQQEAYPPHFVI
jgi:broad specificity phosphatase PhoE